MVLAGGELHIAPLPKRRGAHKTERESLGAPTRAQLPRKARGKGQVANHQVSQGGNYHCLKGGNGWIEGSDANFEPDGG
jgi:hypothetical protein